MYPSRSALYGDNPCRAASNYPGCLFSAVGQRDDMVERSAAFVQIDSASLASIVRPLTHGSFNGRGERFLRRLSPPYLSPRYTIKTKAGTKDYTARFQIWFGNPRVSKKCFKCGFWRSTPRFCGRKSQSNKERGGGWQLSGSKSRLHFLCPFLPESFYLVL